MGFIDDLLGALGTIAAEIAQALLYVLTFIVNVFTFIWGVLSQVAQFFLSLMGSIGKFFSHLWDNFFKGIFTSLFNAIGKFGQWLHAIFEPVVSFLKNVSKYIDRIYRHYVQPILKAIRIARIALTLLRALGVKWAGKLDSILGKVQSDIQRGFLLIKQYLNVFIDLLNILADPSNLLRRPTTLLSLRRIWHAFIRQVTGLPPGFVFPSPSKFAAPGIAGVAGNFNPRDPLQNPPPSYYLAFDAGVPSFDFLGPGEVPDDTTIDTIAPMDFFNNDLYPPIECDDAETCLAELILLAQGAVSNG